MSFVNRIGFAVGPDTFRLFGWDLAAAWSYLRSGWAEALRWPLFSWLTPELAIRVIQADGTESIRSGASARPATPKAKVLGTAVELPEAVLLRRQLVLPLLTDDEVRQAVEMDVRAASPFAEGELAWGYGVQPIEGGRIRVNAALTSRKLIEQRLDELRSRFGESPVEVWAGGPTPFMIPGYGESERILRAHKARSTAFVLLLLALLQATALALTPTLQLRERAIEARSLTDELRRSVQAQAASREEYVKIVDQLRKLGVVAQRQHDLLALLDRITRALPDDTFLIGLEVEGDTVRISGQSDNAAQLMQTLGSDSAFRDVKAPAGIARAGTRGKEGFTIEFGLAAKTEAR